MSETKISWNGRILKFDNIPTAPAPIDLSISSWTTPTPGQIGICGDRLVNYGIGGWHEVAYKEFKVEYNGTYEISYDYEIVNATAGSHATYGFGLWITENQPIEDSSFYTNQDNRNGSVIINTSTTVSDLKGHVSFQLSLIANKSYYIWFPGGALNDGTYYTFYFRNLKAIQTDFVSQPYSGLPGYNTYVPEKHGIYENTLFSCSDSAQNTSGALADSITNYDIIKFYGKNKVSNTADASGSQQYCWAYDSNFLQTHNSAHLQPINSVLGSTNFALWANTFVSCPTNTSFTQTRGGNAFRVTASLNSTATWVYANSGIYLNNLITVTDVVGVKYEGSARELLWSGNNTSAVTLSKPATDFDEIQMLVSISGNDNYDGQNIVSLSPARNANRNSIQFAYGSLGNWYMAYDIINWSDNKHFTIPSAKSLYKALTSTAAMGANTSLNNRIRNCVKAVWGIHW